MPKRKSSGGPIQKERKTRKPKGNPTKKNGEIFGKKRKPPSYLRNVRSS